MNDWLVFLDTDVAPMALAMALGGLVGLERQLNDKPAGLRTMMLICLAAATFTMHTERFESDSAARVVQGIVTGVGFLGAGVLIHTQGSVQGLTTAATIWLVSGIGIGCGLRHFKTAIISTILALAVLWLLAPIDRKLKQKRASQSSQNNAPPPANPAR